MKKIVLFVGFLAVSMVVWTQEIIWDDFYESVNSQEEIVPLTSTDSSALKKAGVYYFSLVNGSNSMKIDTANKEKNAKLAMEYLTAAANLDTKDPVLATWKAVSTLSYAGSAKKLSLKIKFSNLGIGYFNQAARNQGNMDYLFMRIVSYSQVPKNFKNLTSIIKKDAEKYMSLYNSLSRDPGVHDRLKESVKTLHAYAYFQTRDKKEAKELLLSVDEAKLFQGQGEDTSTAKYYFTMKKKLRIK